MNVVNAAAGCRLSREGPVLSCVRGAPKPPAHVRQPRRVVNFVLVAAALLWASSAALAGENFKTVGGFAIYLGVLPAQMILGHPSEHPEQKMHRGVPPGRGHHHVVVAVFDALSGARIDDAAVTATVTEPGFVHVKKGLEPMPIAGAMSYGNYFPMLTKGAYRVDVHVERPTTGKTVDATFIVTPQQW